MDITKIKIGKRVTYRSRVNAGTATVVAVNTKATGTWVTVHDKARKVDVTVRPSQLS